MTNEKKLDVPEISGNGWILSERKFRPEYLGKYESIMCQGNGYMGVRAGTEESYYTGTPCIFVAGTFDKYADEVTELPNVADVTAFPIRINGYILDLTQSHSCEDYCRSLNLKNGLLERSFIWTAPDKSMVKFIFRRIVSLENKHLIAQQVEINPLNADVDISFCSGINGRMTNSGTQHFEEKESRFYEKKYLQCHYTTSQSGIDFYVNCAHRFLLDGKEFEPEASMNIERRKAFLSGTVTVKKSACLRVEKLSTIHTSRDKEYIGTARNNLPERALEALKHASEKDFDIHLQQSAECWGRTVWAEKSVRIEADDPFYQFALRFAIYHITIMTPAHDDRMNIGGKGLSGEGYKGHTFWDTEVFILPHFILAQPTVARSLLVYRYHCLAGARRKAREHGHEGAMYPWECAWIDDGEVTPSIGGVNVVSGETMPILTGKLELHITSDVAFGVDYYYKATGDDEFMRRYGYEIIIDAAKFWQSRLEYNKDLDRYEISDVIGPDEYKEHVNNNAYTNYMAHWCICTALDYAERLKKESPEDYRRIDAVLEMDARLDNWRKKSDKIYLPQPGSDGVIPQDDTYLTLPEIDLSKYKQHEIAGTIYNDYNMEQISGLQVSKQADVLVLVLLLEGMFSDQVKKQNFYYYENRCLHDSSLSLSTHSILAGDLGEMNMALNLFRRACKIDLCSAPGGSIAGIHAASFGGMWQCVINGFMGVRNVNGTLRINPHLPEGWREIACTIYWQGKRLNLTVTTIWLKIASDTNHIVPITVFGKEWMVGETAEIPITNNQRLNN